MRNNSIPLFRVDGAPVLCVSTRPSGNCITLRDSHDDVFGAGVDFYTPNEDTDRLRRAADAFNAVMREPAAQQQEA